MYKIIEVYGTRYADEINAFNALFPEIFDPLKPRHLADGYWWLVHKDVQIVGFAGLVPFLPFPNAGYCKRAAILKAHRGHGLQGELIHAREERARASTDWTHLFAECATGNTVSANNFIRAGFKLCEVERSWEKDTLFWAKRL